MGTVKIFLRDPSPRKEGFNCGTAKIVSATGLRNIIRKSRGKLGQTGKAISITAGHGHVVKTSRNRILGNMAFG